MLEDGRERPFPDRRAAGQQLAQTLMEGGYQGDGLVVLGIPRGGVVVAAEVARALRAPLDVVIARKLRAPHQPELAIGAIVGGEHVLVLNEDIAWATGATPEYLEREIRHQQAEIDHRMRAYRGDRPPLALRGKTVLVVDDGIATGSTLRAALDGLQRQCPARLAVAVPVAARESLEAARARADDVICLATPDPFLAVGAWYEEFAPVTDDEVIALLQRESLEGGRHPSPALRTRGTWTERGEEHESL